MEFASLPVPWRVCAEEAWHAFLHKTVPIGACLLSPEGEVLSRGRNHIYDDDDDGNDPPPIALHKLAHAEVNCLFAVKDTTNSFSQCTLYTTVEPCPLCMGAIYMMGVRNLQYAVADPYAGSTNLLNTTDYLKVKPVIVTAMPDQDFVNVMAAMNFYFFFFEAERRDNQWSAQNGVMRLWQASHPAAHALASKVWQQYPAYQAPFMQMDVAQGLAFWQGQL
jgi:tRNA(adenine34) deaminase